MRRKTGALVATMAAGAMLCFGAPVSAATDLAATPNSDLARRPLDTARTDWASSPAAAGSDLIVAPGPGSGAAASTTLADDVFGPVLSTPPRQTPAAGFGPALWTLLILAVALIGLAARRGGTRSFATDERSWGRSSGRSAGRRYSRNFSIFNYYTHDD